VVGRSDLAPRTSAALSPTRGFWWEGGTLFDLNDAGQIAALGVANGVTHAVLLTPAG
jgi:hypothetical protein